MLNKKRTANWARLRLLLALPLTGGMLCISTMAFTKSYGYVDLLPESISFQNSDQKSIDEKEMAKKGWYSPSYVFDENNQYKSLEKRLIVINDITIKDNNKFYGISNASKILFLNAKDATNKYSAKGKFGAVEIYGKATVLTYHEPYVIADTAKFPAPKFTTKSDQVKPGKFVTKPDSKNLKPSPPIETPPANYKAKTGQVNKAINSSGSIPKVEKVVQGYPLRKDNDDLKEVSVVGYGTQSNAEKVVQGYPINSNGNQIKEVKVQGYPQKSNLKGTVKGYPINNTEIKEVKVQGYQTKQDNPKSNEPAIVDGDVVEKPIQHQTKLNGLASPKSLAKSPIAYTLRGKVNTHLYVTASTTVYLSDSLRIKKNN